MKNEDTYVSSFGVKSATVYVCKTLYSVYCSSVALVMSYKLPYRYYFLLVVNSVRFHNIIIVISYVDGKVN